MLLPFVSNLVCPPLGSTYPTYKAPKVIVTNTDPGNCSTGANSCFDDLLENTLDVEWSGATAKNAQIVLVTSASSATTDGAYLSEQYIVGNKTAPVLSASYGECELILGTSGNTAYYNLWQSAAAAGIAVFVSSGDSGSPSCDNGQDSDGAPYAAEFGLSVSGLASTPYDTAVGGTDFNWGATASPYWSSSNNSTTGASALGYVPEIPWNNTCTNPVIEADLANYVNQNYGYSGSNSEVLCNIYASDSNLYVYVDVSGTGGGKSSCTVNSTTSTSTTIDVTSCMQGYDKPSWQANVTGIPADGKRDIPDVSFFAADGALGSSYLICATITGGSCTYSATSEPQALEVGGTSVGSPAMAGVMALINQASGASQGSPNTELYKLASQQSYSSCAAESVTASSACMFNDIDTGTNAMPCDEGAFGYTSPDCTANQSFQGVADTIGILNGYSGTVGYDLATGLGSLNVANVVNGFAALNAPAVSFSPTSLSFTVQAGATSASQAITVKNSGIDALAISGITVTGANASAFTQTNTCPASLDDSASCVINVIFTGPSTAGTSTAFISVADNQSGSPQTVALTGIVQAVTPPNPTFTLAAPALSVTPGTAGSDTVTVTPAGGYTGTVTLTCSVSVLSGGTDAPTCSGSSATVTGSGGTGTVTINTTAPSSSVRRTIIASQSRSNWKGVGAVAIAGLMLLGIPARRRSWRMILSVLVLIAGFGVLSGCGGSGGSGSKTPSDPGTTAGTYTVTVTGVDSVTSSIKASTTFTLTVN